MAENGHSGGRSSLCPAESLPAVTPNHNCHHISGPIFNLYRDAYQNQIPGMPIWRLKISKTLVGVSVDTHVPFYTSGKPGIYNPAWNSCIWQLHMKPHDISGSFNTVNPDVKHHIRCWTRTVIFFCLNHIFFIEGHNWLCSVLTSGSLLIF